MSAPSTAEVRWAGVTWGPVMADDLETITFPGSSDWVKVQRYITEEDDSLASDAAMAEGMKVLGANRAQRRAAKKQLDQADYQMYYKTGAYRMIILRRLIKAWSFPVPCTPENIGKLPTHTRDYIMARIDEWNPHVTDEEDEELPDGTPNPLASEPSIEAV